MKTDPRHKYLNREAVRLSKQLNAALADPTNDLLEVISKLEWVLSQADLADDFHKEVRSAIALLRPHCIDPKDSNR